MFDKQSKNMSESLGENSSYIFSTFRFGKNCWIVSMNLWDKQSASIVNLVIFGRRAGVNSQVWKKHEALEQTLRASRLGPNCLRIAKKCSSSLNHSYDNRLSFGSEVSE